MSIKSVSEFNQVLKNNRVDNWTRSAEIGHGKIDSEAAMKESNGVKSFGDFLLDSISQVDQLQKTADIEMQKLASGEQKNLHETLMAVEKADIAFKTMNQVRMKIVDAYREIMRMQI